MSGESEREEPGMVPEELGHAHFVGTGTGALT